MNIVNSVYSYIHYENAVLFHIFSKKITFGEGFFRKKSIEQKVDNMFKRIQDLLNVQVVLRLRIELYERKDMLLPKGYYTHSSRTIFINPREVKNSILAHEMAHAILDTALGRRPPRRIGEIIAMYVARNI